MKSRIIFILIAFLSTISFAQTKVGTIDTDYIIGLMPESKIVLERTQDYGAKLDSTFNIKLAEYKTKVDDYKKNEETLGVLAKKTTIQELTEMEADINRYQQNGQKLLQLKQEELMRPLYKKLNDVIQEVAKAEKYTQILTISGNQFAYIDSKFDLTELVMSKLGIEIPKETK
ncbi:OmpH family outer membrane protein [Polaribacter sargassicola]|uniref:OmpH family outer membrane protein n=1 Tax=Polaribacter sargassicola TaxID=2836891 RepID=UPI001F468786|nr:OmpH family outer membrane protein [Polaribacter sp. DS7-9]MCG1037232.1 OmpH family outer membrane protein [Polaribacter sp. DS7-9]